MRADTGTVFKGEAPRYAPDKLPAGYAARALNCRLLSGSLQAWRAPATAEQVIAKPGTIRSLWLADPAGLSGGPFPYHWTEIVSVARGMHLGDTEERTYFTGTAEGPRVTTLPLGTDEPPPGGAPDVGKYPYRSYPMGVAKPTTAPTVVVDDNTPAPNEIVIDNPGAEDFAAVPDPPAAPAVWVNSGPFVLNTGGNGDILGFDAAVGVRYFSAADPVAQTGEAYLEYFLADLGIVVGQTLKFVWQQAHGPAGSKAAIGVEFYDDAAVLLPMGRTLGAVVASAGADYTWAERVLDGIVAPANAFAMRIIQRYENVGGGATDAYIDEIELFAGTASITFDGASLSDLEVEVGGGDASVTLDATHGWPPPSIRFTSEHGDVGSLKGDFNVDDAAMVRCVYDFQWTNTSNSLDHYFAIGADAAGSGYGLMISEDGVDLVNHASWTTRGAKVKTLLNSFEDGVHFRVDATFIRASATNGTFQYKIIKADTNAILVSGSEDVPLKGPYIGWKGAHNGGGVANGYLDNVAITITPRAAGDAEQTEFADYVYTYVDILGRESAPSPASVIVAINDNASRTITTDVVGIAGYPIVSKRIYRLVTGTNGSSYLLVAEIPLAQADYVDTKTDKQLGAVLVTQGWEVPPTDLFAIVAGPRFMAGLSKNQVCFSKLDNPHAWDPLDRRPMDFPGVGLAVVDNDFFALSEARPYIAQGIDPTDMDLQALSKPIGCVSLQSVVTYSPYGVVYATSDGLSYANRSDTDLLTRSLFTEREWARFNPPSIMGVVHDGMYFGFYDAEGMEFENDDESVTAGVKGGFIIDLSKDGFGYVPLSLYATAAYSNPTNDRLYLVIDGELVIWNEGDTKLEYDYLSREILHDYPTSYEFAYVDVLLPRDDCNFRVYYDSLLVRDVDPGRLEFRMSDTVCERAMQFRLTGTNTVRRAPAIATDVEELV